MKAFRFCSLMALAILMTAGLTACSSDDKEFMGNEPVASYKGEVVKGISVSLSDFESAGAETRTAYSATDGGIKVTWASNDTIGIFPNVGGQVEFPIEAGTASNQATFDGGGWALKSNSTYAAYYPYSAKNSYYTNKNIQVKYTGQKQTANGKTSLLGKYDYQATSGVTTNSSGYLNFQFKHLGALMVFQLTVPKAGTYTSLTLTSTEKVFVTKAELDISGNEPMLKAVSKSKTVTLALGNIALEADNSVLTAYMMLAPVDLSQGSLELTIDGDRIFTTTLDGHNLEAGKQYTIEKAFVDDTPSPDEIINFADDNVKAICIENWDTNKDGELSYEEAAAVTDIGNKFYVKTKIKSFDEFQYFTGVTSVQENAFKSCIALESIVLPNSLQETSSNMFDGCGKLKNVTITEGVKSISGYTFNNCLSLTEITLPSSLTSIGSYAFSGSSFISILIPEGVKYIGERAFDGCSSLTSIVISKGVTSIGEYAFNSCSNLTRIVISEGIKTISCYTFNNCRSLTEITLPSSLISIGSYAFTGSYLTNIVIPKGVTTINDNAFYRCNRLISIVIPEGVTSIGNSAFDGCSNLTNIEIPKNLSSIGDRAFAGCSSLTNIMIPEGLTSIGSYAFYCCRSLTNIVIPEGVTYIRGGAFESCSSLTSIVIPEGVTSIEDEAFSGCSSLTSIVIPEGVTSICAHAFLCCRNLTSIVIPDGVVSIGYSNGYAAGNGGTFYGCDNLSKIICLATIPPHFSGIIYGDEDPIPEFVFSGIFYVPAASVEAYKAADGWSEYADRIQAIPE